jgi:hypothetical protein
MNSAYLRFSSSDQEPALAHRSSQHSPTLAFSILDLLYQQSNSPSYSKNWLLAQPFFNNIALRSSTASIILAQLLILDEGRRLAMPIYWKTHLLITPITIKTKTVILDWHL